MSTSAAYAPQVHKSITITTPLVTITNLYKATLRKARRDYECAVCGYVIAKGEDYYSVQRDNGSMGLRLDTEPVHPFELDKFMEITAEKQGGQVD